MEQVKGALSESEKSFWYVLGTTDDAVLITDDDGFLSYVSPNTAELFELRVEDVWQLEHISALVGERLFDLAELKRAGAINHIEFPLKTTQGETRTLRINVRAVALRQGSILYCCRDITEAKKAEQVLRDLERMKDEFISMASHELRTPLTVVQGYAELLLRQPDIEAESRQRSIAIIFEKTQELAKITNDLLDLCQDRDNQCLNLRKRAVYAKDLIERVTTKACHKIPPHRLAKQLPEAPVCLLIDETRFERVLEILLDNAIKYSPPHGLITICGQQKGEDFLFLIKDEGIGMTPEQRDKVFDKFYRADCSNSAVPGLGLGMSIARKIVEEHGGRIWIESTPGKGTRVYFTVPMVGEHPSHGCLPYHENH